MKNIKIKKLLRLCLVFFLSTILTESYSQKSEYDETVNVIGTYEPQLIQARKIAFNPSIKDTTVKIQDIKYSILSFPLDYDYEVRLIPPAKMVGESFTKLYKNYIKAGFGNYATSYAELFYQSDRNKSIRTSLNIKHLSSMRKIKDYTYPYSDNEVKFSGSYLMKNYSLWSGVSYKRDALHFYGFKPKEYGIPEKKDIKQVYQLFDFGFDADSRYNRESMLHHSVKLRYQGLWDRLKTNENNILLDFDMKKNYTFLGFLKNESFNIDLHSGFHTLDNKSPNDPHGHIDFKPYINAQMDEMELSIGANICMQIDDSDGEVFFFPYGRLDIRLVPDHLKTFIGYEGYVEHSTIRSLYQQNPFINTEIISSCHVKTNGKLYGGVTGGFGGNFFYRLEAMNRKIENMPLFVNSFIIGNDTITGNRFMIINDDVDILSFLMEIQSEVTPKFEVILLAGYHVYDAKTEKQAWHLPLYDGSLGFIYNIRNKLYGKANVFAYGKRFAKDNNQPEEPIKLLPIWDFNLGLEYRYSKLLSGFIQFNNFTAQRHSYWNNYPSQRLNLMLGVSYSF